MASHEGAGDDRFERKLDAMIEQLRQCQKTQGLSSCSGCAKLLECELRRAYVLAVYDSMSKGQTGGFEF